LSSLESVRTFADAMKTELESLYALVNNAGVFWCPYLLTKDGYEMNFGVNHLGHFLLTLLLLPLLRREKDGARIVTVASMMCMFGDLKFDDLYFVRRGYNFVRAYSDSKLANVLFTRELSKRLKHTNVKTYCVNPGTVYTDIGRDSFFMGSLVYRVFCRPLTWLLFKDAWGGAQTSVYCVCAQGVEGESGMMYSDCKQRSLWWNVYDEKVSDQLWDMSLNLTSLTEEDVKSLISS